MYFAELEGNKVRHVGGGEDYKILPPKCIEIADTKDVKQGQIYDGSKFVDAPAKEESTPTAKFTVPLTDEQRDFILVRLAERYGIEPEEIG